jgi:hypothetical protein
MAVRTAHIGWGIMAIGLAAAGWLVAGVPRGAPGGSSPGMRAYVDPRTGAFTATPPSGAAAGTTPMPAETIVEKPLAGGGVMAHVPNRLKKPLVATIGCDGRAHIGHETAADQPAARSCGE